MKLLVAIFVVFAAFFCANAETKLERLRGALKKAIHGEKPVPEAHFYPVFEEGKEPKAKISLQETFKNLPKVFETILKPKKAEKPFPEPQFHPVLGEDKPQKPQISLHEAVNSLPKLFANVLKLKKDTKQENPCLGEFPNGTDEAAHFESCDEDSIFEVERVEVQHPDGTPMYPIDLTGVVHFVATINNRGPQVEKVIAAATLDQREYSPPFACGWKDVPTFNQLDRLDFCVPQLGDNCPVAQGEGTLTLRIDFGDPEYQEIIDLMPSGVAYRFILNVKDESNDADLACVNLQAVCTK